MKTTDKTMGVTHRFKGESGKFDWEDVRREPYTGDGAVGGTKLSIIGPQEGAHNFTFRYYEVEPGGRTSFDRHTHDHGVLIVKGKARVLIGGEKKEVGFGDVIYIGPNEPHQFESIGDEALGCFCVASPKEVDSNGYLSNEIGALFFRSLIDLE